MITIDNLTRRYGSTVAVDHLSTTIAPGEIVGLLGHNGAGKTTVMKILTGFLEASEGTVTINGHDVQREREQVQRAIGYLPENAPLYDEMLVQEYLLTMAELRGVPVEHLARRVAHVAQATGLTDRLLSPIHTLSKGLRQRVGIAQAIVHEPAVLILDEPTNGLDPMQIESIRRLVKELGKKTTVLLSTHILQEVEAVCDRVLVMIGGRLVADARLSELLDTRRIQLVLGDDAQGVPSALAGVEGITAVTRGVAAGGTVAWHLEWSGAAAPVPGIVEAASKAQWRVHAVGPEQRTLEMVFKDLQAEHARGGAA